MNLFYNVLTCKVSDLSETRNNNNNNTKRIHNFTYLTIILLTTNPCRLVHDFDTRTRHTWFRKLKRQTTEENVRLGNRKNDRMRATAGVAESSVHARKTDSITSPVAANRRLAEYPVLD